jgi:hypothetical protein
VPRIQAEMCVPRRCPQKPSGATIQAQ